MMGALFSFLIDKYGRKNPTILALFTLCLFSIVGAVV